MTASRPVRFAFWLAAILALLNLNHASNMLAGTGWPFTVGLVLCCAFLCLAARVPVRRALGAPGLLIVAALASYLLIGLSVLLLTGEGLHTTDYTLLARPGLAILIIVAAALSATVMLQRVEAESLLEWILAILAVACIALLLTPWLDQYYSLSAGTVVAEHALGDNRFIGLFASPNNASIVACYAVALALPLLLGGRNRMFAGSVALLGSVAAFLTFTRTGFLALAVIFLAFLGISVYRLHLKWSSAGWTLTVIALITSAFVFSVINIEDFGEYFTIQDSQLRRLSWDHNVEGFSESRFSLWYLGLSQIAQSPIFGHGFSHFHFLESARTCQQSLTPCGVHSTYLLLWGEAGILPLSLLLLFIGSLLWRWRTLPRSVAADAAASCILVFAVACVSIDGVPYFIGTSFILGVSCAVMSRAARESRGPRPGRTPRTPSASVRTAARGIAPSGSG